MNRLHYILGAAALAVALSALPAHGSWQSGRYGSVDEVELAMADSVQVPDLMERAAELHRAVVAARAAGRADDMYYDSAVVCFEASVAALDSCDKNSDEYARIKSILRDINPVLEEGAYHFSSSVNQAAMSRSARAFVDTHLLDAFAGEKFRMDQRGYPSMVYIAASDAYNHQDFGKAIDYFKLYFSTGEPTRREQVYMYMGQACLNAGQYDLAVSTMLEAVKAFPANYHLVSFGIKACIDGGHSEYLQSLLDKALSLKPGDEQLLNIQAKLLEDEHEYIKALEVFAKIDEARPNNLNTARHIALCYYNLGVDFYNQAITATDERSARKFKRQSNDYFSAAADKLEEVVANDPTGVKYLKALAVSYGCMDDAGKFEEVNTRIQALGEDPLPQVSMPPLMSVNENNMRNYGRSDGIAISGDDVDGVPLFSEYARHAVEERLTKWTAKGEFERDDEYKRRVNDATIRDEYMRACREAESEYIEKYARKLRLTDLKLMPYDATNEVYMVESSYGPMYVHVPLSNNEAELFKSNWAGIHFRNPRYAVVDNEVRVASLTFVTPTGKSYTYDNSDALAYTSSDIDIDFKAILSGVNQGRNMAQNGGGQSANRLKVTRLSDVDENIPVTKRPNRSTIALVIANENYSGVPAVESAIHDGETVAKYLNMTLGLPKENIMLHKDVTLGGMYRAMAHVKNTVKSMGPGTDLIVYYAGHGMPDERSRDALLLPVDGDPLTSESCYSLNLLYDELSSAGADNVMVFLDACFSGSQRGEGMLVATRGVAIAAQEADPRGCMFVLSATSGQETALPYKDKNHGLFTYYLLKKLQLSEGKVTLAELADYVKSNVTRQSNLINHKPQTPTMTLSGDMSRLYQKKRMCAD